MATPDTQVPTTGRAAANSSNGSSSGSYDAIVVGGGHNGLTTAAYLAKAGKKVLVLERRPILGGACVTEELWPGRRVSRASYVVSMLQPQIVKDLRLEDFGYHAVPLDPAYAALTPEGPVVFYDDPRATAESIRPLSAHDADNFVAFEERLFRVADFLNPMLMREPPALGSKKPGDLLSLAREGARAAGLSRRDVHELVRMFTMSVADMLDEYFEHEAIKGSIASTGVVGVWAGPNTPGTAYNLLHHALGELNGIKGAWGHVMGGMGAISEAIAASARAAGAEIRTDAEVTSIDVQGERVVGVTLASGEELRAPIVASGAHPKNTILDLAGAENFSEEIVEDMRRFRTRGGSVKINMILKEPPQYVGVDAAMQETLRHTGVNLCPSIDYLERAWQEAQGGKPAAEPYVEAELPSAIDSGLTDDGTWVMTMFTQYGPPDEAGWPEGAREKYADACVEHLARYAPNVPDAILEREVLAPPDIERIFGLTGGSIFQGEQGMDQMAFMRPSPYLAGYATPVDGLYLCGAGTHPGGGVMAASGHNAAKRILKDGRFDRLRRRGTASTTR
jgi:phytoene dehydrogenase-like protein